MLSLPTPARPVFCYGRSPPLGSINRAAHLWKHCNHCKRVSLLISPLTTKNSHKRITLAVGLLFGLCLPKLKLVILNSGATKYVALTVGLSSKMPVQRPGHQHVIFPSQCGELLSRPKPFRINMPQVMSSWFQLTQHSYLTRDNDFGV